MTFKPCFVKNAKIIEKYKNYIKPCFVGYLVSHKIGYFFFIRYKLAEPAYLKGQKCGDGETQNFLGNSCTSCKKFEKFSNDILSSFFFNEEWRTSVRSQNG